MPVEMVQIRHKKTKAVSNTPRTQLPRYTENGWEEVKDTATVQSPVTVATPTAAESVADSKKENAR